MAVRTIAAADAEDRRQRVIIILLFVVGFTGLSYLVYDYLQIIDRTKIPEELAAVDPVVARWQEQGLVESFDASRARLVVYEDAWNERRREEKVGIVTQLARYCAKKNNQSEWQLTVLGKSTSVILGEIGSSGLRVN